MIPRTPEIEYLDREDPFCSVETWIFIIQENGDSHLTRFIEITATSDSFPKNKCYPLYFGKPIKDVNIDGSTSKLKRINDTRYALLLDDEISADKSFTKQIGANYSLFVNSKSKEKQVFQTFNTESLSIPISIKLIYKLPQNLLGYSFNIPSNKELFKVTSKNQIECEITNRSFMEVKFSFKEKDFLKPLLLIISLLAVIYICTSSQEPNIAIATFIAAVGINIFSNKFL